jgi:hypothetical protein
LPSPYGPTLTGIGLLQGSKLTDAARAAYVAEVVGLLATGNANGKGGLPATKVFSSLVPLPPVPGPTIANLTTLQQEPLFWFGPDPAAAAMATILADPTRSPTWNAIFPDGALTLTAQALDVNGATPLFPIFDASIAFPNVKGFPLALPDLAVQANVLPLPKLLAKLADLGIQLSIPSPPPLPVLQLPTLSAQFPQLGLQAAVALPTFTLGLLAIPLQVITALLLPPNLGLVLDLVQLKLDAVFNLAFKALVALLQPLVPIIPKLLVASCLIWLKDVVAMLCVDLVGMLVGSGGTLTKLVGTATGLIPA